MCRKNSCGTLPAPSAGSTKLVDEACAVMKSRLLALHAPEAASTDPALSLRIGRAGRQSITAPLPTDVISANHLIFGNHSIGASDHSWNVTSVRGDGYCQDILVFRARSFEFASLIELDRERYLLHAKASATA